jgi:hypothetical protein
MRDCLERNESILPADTLWRDRQLSLKNHADLGAESNIARPLRVIALSFLSLLSQLIDLLCIFFEPLNHFWQVTK